MVNLEGQGARGFFSTVGEIISHLPEIVHAVASQAFKDGHYFDPKTTLFSFLAACYFVSAGASFGQTVLLTSAFAIGYMIGKRVADAVLPPLDERLRAFISAQIGRQI